jgi:putative sigma-54 modulation protein
MKIMITRRNGNLSESLKDYIEKKVSELSRHYQNIIDAHVILDSDGRDNTVEIVMRISRHTLRSKVSSSNLRAAIDGCVEKLDKQLIKVKDKVRRKIHSPEEEVLAGNVSPAEEPEAETEIQDEPLLSFDKDNLVFEPEGTN